MNIRYRVDLSNDEENELRSMLAGGKLSVRKVKRAQILLSANQGFSDKQIAKNVQASIPTVQRTRQRFVEGNLEKALHENPRPGAKRLLSDKDEALLIATACAKPPAGRSRWTLQLLAGQVAELTNSPGLSRETVRRRLKENKLKPWQYKMWCIPKVDAEYVARMEDILDLYAEDKDAEKPVVCFDESPTQLIGEVRNPVPASPGHTGRCDYEYKRNGTANLFVFIDAHRSWRTVKVTSHRNHLDFSECMRDLVDTHYPESKIVRVVLDNLSTHSPASLYRSFSPDEARRILRRIEFHFTPKHASWLNMVEIEIGVLKSQCLNRRIGDRMTLEKEIAAWMDGRNLSKAKINWMFNVEKARKKMGKAYPNINKSV